MLLIPDQPRQVAAAATMGELAMPVKGGFRNGILELARHVSFVGLHDTPAGVGRYQADSVWRRGWNPVQAQIMSYLQPNSRVSAGARSLHSGFRSAASLPCHLCQRRRRGFRTECGRTGGTIGGDRRVAHPLPGPAGSGGDRRHAE